MMKLAKELFCNEYYNMNDDYCSNRNIINYSKKICNQCSTCIYKSSNKCKDNNNFSTNINYTSNKDLY